MDLLSIGILWLFVGLISGFISSSPIGPINLWIVNQVAQNRDHQLRWFIGGVILADTSFAGFAYWGYSAFLQAAANLPLYQGIAGAFLCILGASCLINIRRQANLQTTEKPSLLPTDSPMKQLLMGLSLCGSNPAFLLFWLFVIDFVRQHIDVQISASGFLCFLAGIAVGDACWFNLLRKWVSKGLNLAKPAILLTIRYAISLSILGLGGFGLWRSVRGYL